MLESTQPVNGFHGTTGLAAIIDLDLGVSWMSCDAHTRTHTPPPPRCCGYSVTLAASTRLISVLGAIRNYNASSPQRLLVALLEIPKVSSSQSSPPSSPGAATSADNDCNRRHRKPKTKKAPTVISTGLCY